jgi:hypothetical protein
LGSLAFRGEKGVLKVSPTAMLRLRWNPFYPYLEQRTLEFLGLGLGYQDREPIESEIDATSGT